MIYSLRNLNNNKRRLPLKRGKKRNFKLNWIDVGFELKLVISWEQIQPPTK